MTVIRKWRELSDLPCVKELGMGHKVAHIIGTTNATRCTTLALGKNIADGFAKGLDGGKNIRREPTEVMRNMAIKMTLEDGTVVECTAEELSELQRLLGEKSREMVPEGRLVKVTKCLVGNREGYVGFSKVGQGVVAIGSVGEVTEEVASGIYVRFDAGTTDHEKHSDIKRFFLADGEYEVIIDEDSEKNVADSTPKVDKAKKGDLIRITDKTLRHTMRDMTVGKVYKVVDGVLPSESFAEVIDEVGYQASAIDGGYEVVTHDIDAVKEYFTQGSRVQINIPEYEDTEYSRAGITNDEVGEVIRVRERGFEDVVIVEIDFPSWSCSWVGSPEELIVVEAAEEKEDDEPKVGDIVRVTGSVSGHPIGTIGEVVPAPEFFGTDVAVLANGQKRSHIYKMEIICRKEDRIDV